ncbi:MAG: esterase-like activity of phytase family protein [Bacteroidaceae bacterium]|nr:esterase-like activity of phytase family protein [Bacteroidaceae bacterium]
MNFKLLLTLLCLPALVWGGPRYRLSRWGLPAGHYSGITPLGEGRYAVVSDKDKDLSFRVWQMDMDSVSGKVRGLEDITETVVTARRGMEACRDAEGIAYCEQRGTLFVSGEADQRIIEYRPDGSPTGDELPVPVQFGIRHIQPNRGFEALGYDSRRQVFWTCVESPLKGEAAGRLTLLQFRLQDAAADCEEQCAVVSYRGRPALSGVSVDTTVAYTLSAPQVRKSGRDYYHGVAAITPLPDGTLLVLEREALITRSGSGSRCWVRLFRFWPQTGRKVQVGEWRSRFTPFNTRFANYEGMCLGPVLKDGTQTLFLVCDSQSRYGRGMWHLKDFLRVVRLPHFE